MPEGLSIRTNRYLVAGISATKEARLQRASEMVSAWLGIEPDYLGLNELMPATTDWYTSKDDEVSIEEQDGITRDLQAKLDAQVADENIFGTAPAIERGLPPCKRVNKEG